MKRDFSRFAQEIKDKRVAVVGIGVSNLPLIEFLLKLGAQVSAFDKRSFEALDPRVDAFKDQVTFHLGDDYLDSLTGFEVIFRTPGMHPDNPALVKAAQAGAQITSEMREFIRHCPAKVIGVTGSDGKSTTTTMIHGLLEAAGHKSWIGGNIGMPLFDRIEEMTVEDFVVVELSSFQLMDMDVSPQVAVITNLSPNHLDVHKGMAEYRDAKKNIFLHQGPEDVLIVNEDNAYTKAFAEEAKGQVLKFSSLRMADAFYKEDEIYLDKALVVKLSEMKVKGVHNAENFSAALLATKGLVGLDQAAEFAKTFTGVPHRAQFIRSYNEVRYYNDSIASSPTRTLATLRSFAPDYGKITILLGGYDKNLDYGELAEEAGPILRNIILMGAAADKIEKAFMAAKADPHKLHRVNSLLEGVNLAEELTLPGDVVLLSPACASFDMFKNFEDRGNQFTELVHGL